MKFTGNYPFTETVALYDGKDYRYGFNGKENDNDVIGKGRWQDYGMRMYRPDLGRFFSVDPIENEFPWLTPYQFSSNNPIIYVDFDGLEGVANGIRQTPRVSMQTYNSINNQRYNLRKIYSPNSTPRSQTPRRQFIIYDEAKIPGGSSLTDPLITKDNINGHILNILFEGLANYVEYKDRLNTKFRIEEYISNAFSSKSSTSYKVIFEDKKAQFLFEKAQAEYEKNFQKAMNGILPPDIKDVDFTNQLEASNYNIQLSAYELQKNLVKQKIGNSPLERLLDLVNNIYKDEFTVDQEVEIQPSINSN